MLIFVFGKGTCLLMVTSMTCDTRTDITMLRFFFSPFLWRLNDSKRN